MALAAALNTAKSWGINKLTEENPDTAYYLARENGCEYFQCDLSSTPTSRYGAAEMRSYHQVNIFVNDINGVPHPEGKYKDLKKFNISMNLPNSFSYSFGSTWSTPIPEVMGKEKSAAVQIGVGAVAGGLNAVGNYINQEWRNGAQDKNWLQSGADMLQNNFGSGTHLSSTVLVWEKPEPLTITLKIPVFDDVDKVEPTLGFVPNLREVLNLLSYMALPQQNGAVGFLLPPPSPGELPIIGKTVSVNATSNHADIRVQIGGMLALNSCILEKVDVSYNNTRSLIRKEETINNESSFYLSPLLAELTLTFKSVQGLTALEFSQMMWLKTVNRQVTVETKDSENKGLLSTLKNKVSGMFSK